jgi:hypothetical protein
MADARPRRAYLDWLRGITVLIAGFHQGVGSAAGLRVFLMPGVYMAKEWTADRVRLRAADRS